MEKKSKGKTIVIVILVLLVLGLGGYIVYDKTLNSKEEALDVKDETKTNEPPVKTYNYNDIKGLYTYTAQEIYSEAGDGMVTPKYNLYLYGNGMFFYDHCSHICEGNIGNYTIVDNTVVLNNLFGTHSDISLDVTNSTKTLTINKDGSLTDNEQPYSFVKEKTITLTKSSTDINYQDIIDRFKAFINYCETRDL